MTQQDDDSFENCLSNDLVEASIKNIGSTQRVLGMWCLVQHVSLALEQGLTYEEILHTVASALDKFKISEEAITKELRAVFDTDKKNGDN